MGAKVELNYPGKDQDEQTRRAEWSAPKVAYARYQPGLSPYLHYWQVLRSRRDQAEPPKDFDPDAGRTIPDQIKSTLDDLVRRSLGS